MLPACPLTWVLPAELPGPAVGSGRLDGAGPSRPACPPASPAARSPIQVASRTGHQKVQVHLSACPLNWVLPAGLPGPAVGSGRLDAAGPGRPACPPASPAARSPIQVASRTGHQKVQVHLSACPLNWVLPAGLPGPAVGSGRLDAAGPGRPACPPASPVARSLIQVASRTGHQKVGVYLSASPLGWVLPAQQPGPAVGSGRVDGAGPSRPACPPASPVA